jgi:hypothetical protein
MGNSQVSVLAPLHVIDCDLCIDCTDARYDYQCEQVDGRRWAMTTLHLLIMVVIFFTTLLLYMIFLRVCARRFDYQLRAMPLKYLPIGRDVLSRRMQRELVDGFTRILNVNNQLPAANSILTSHAGLGVDILQSVNLRQAVLELSRDFCDLVSKVAPDGWAKAGGSLRLAAPMLIEDLHLQPRLVWTLVTAMERAEFGSSPSSPSAPSSSAAPSAASFTEDEFLRLRELVWHAMNGIRWSAMGQVTLRRQASADVAIGLMADR